MVVDDGGWWMVDGWMDGWLWWCWYWWWWVMIVDVKMKVVAVGGWVLVGGGVGVWFP